MGRTGEGEHPFGSFYFWGDVGSVGGQVVAGKLQFGQAVRAARRAGGKRNPDGTGHPQGSWFAIADSKERGASTKNDGGSWFNIAHNTESGTGNNPVNALAMEGVKQRGSGAEWFDTEIAALPSGSKTIGHANKRNGHSHTRHLTNQRESDGVKVGGVTLSEVGFNVAASRMMDIAIPEGFKRDETMKRQHIGLSRKAASAQIAKIPFPIYLLLHRTRFQVLDFGICRSISMVSRKKRIVLFR